MRSSRVIVRTWLAALALGQTAYADVTRPTKLDNDLTVLLKPVEAAENVAVMTLFGIGGDQDPPGQSGRAHLIEHLYVCCGAGGTQPRTVQQFIQVYPAGWNAYTGDDFTVYATVVPRAKLREELKDVAARMTQLTVTAEEIQREKSRLLVEVANMFGGSPELAVFNLGRQRARPGRKNTRRGGVPEQIDRIARGAIQECLDRYYKPCNAILVIAGGFDAATTMADVRALFGSIPPGERAPSLSGLEAPKFGETVTTTIRPTLPGRLPQVCIACPAPLPSERGYVAFLVIATRLMQRMQDDASQDGLRVHYAPLDDPSVLLLQTPSKEGETAENAMSRLAALLDEACGAPLDPLELQRVRNGLGAFVGLSDLPDAIWAQNPYGLAFSIGRQHQLDVRRVPLRRELDSMRSDALREAATRFLATENRVTVVVQPMASSRSSR